MSGVDTRLPADDSEALDGLIRALSAGGSTEMGYEVLDRRRLPGSTNLIVRVTGDGPAPELFVKRLHRKSHRRHEAARTKRDRPRLKPVPDPARRLADEAASLIAIQKLVAASGRSDWFAVPVVEVPDRPDMLVLERVDASTLTEQIRRGAPQGLLDRAARSLGEWLHTLHTRLPQPAHARPRLRNRAELVERAETMIGFVDSRRLRRHRSSIMDAIAAVPPDFELVPSHGDFAPQNVFLTDDGAIAVFDTTTSLLLPRHFDPAYFSVVLEFAGLKQPVPRSSASEDRMAGLLREGYGPDLPPRSELLAFELLLLLDRWCSISLRPERAVRPVDAVRWGRRQALGGRLDRAIAHRLDRLGGGG